MRSLSPGRALTIAELLVVVVLILILAMLLVVGGGHAHSAAVQLQCQHHLEQIGQACSVYATQYQGLWPRSYDTLSARQWYWTLAPRYLADTTVLNCPATDARLSEPRPDWANLTRQDKVELAVLKALRWLKSQQLSNGRWPANPGEGEAHRAVWGMALGAFVRLGCTADEPREFAPTVDKGLAAAVRAANLELGTSDDSKVAAYGTILTALAHAYRTTGDRVYRIGSTPYSITQSAARVLDLIRLDQWPQHGGFDYGRAGYPYHNNMSAGTWVLNGVADAHNAGISVPQSVLAAVDKNLGLCTVIANRYKCTNPSCRMCTSNYVFCSACNLKKARGYVNRICKDVLQGTKDCTGTYLPCGWRGNTGGDYCPRCGAKLETSWVGDATELVGGNCPVCGGAVTKADDDYRTWEYAAWPVLALTGAAAHSFDNYVPHWTAGALAARLTLGGKHNPAGGSGYSPGEITGRQLDRFLGITSPSREADIYKFAFRSSWDAWTMYFATIVMNKLGGDRWTDWQNRYIDIVLAAQNPDGSWPRDRMLFIGRNRVGDVGTTALLCQALIFSLDDWQDIQELTTEGACTYGYNNQVGLDRRAPAADTVIVMDYENWEIDRNGQQVDDPPEFIAPRHGGRANVLFGDGRVETIAPEAVRDGMFTVQPGD